MRFIFWFIKRYNYFIVCPVKTISENSLPKDVIKFVEHFFYMRRFKINYFEPYIKEPYHILFGTCEVKDGAINKRAYLFIMQYFLFLKNNNKEFLKEYYHSTKKIYGVELLIYKVKRQ